MSRAKSIFGNKYQDSVFSSRKDKRRNEMNYADIKELDIQDGDGARVSIYVSGCHFKCKGCHNKEAWDFNYGKKFTQKEIDYIIELMDNDYISGLSILGGEPLEIVNQIGLVPLVKQIKEKFPEKDIWCYTGYDFEKDVLNNMYNKFNFTKELLDEIDIIVDGQFIESQKIVDLKFRGSFNQRKIDVQASLHEGKIVMMKFGDESRYETKVKTPKIIWITEFAKDKEKLQKPVYMSASGVVTNENIINTSEEKIVVTKENIRVAAKGIV